MSIFDRMDRATSRVIDRLHGMRFVLYPQTSTPNGRSEGDAYRNSWIGKGVLKRLPAYDVIEIGKRNRTGHDFQTPVVGEKIELSVDCHRYPEAAKARQRDRIETDDLRKFEIISIQPDGLSRTVFQLIELR
ncbi:hypothetical protein K1X45_13385 [Pseudochrobactrum sp. Wa41.01b-1]|uniref:hypothetical protein n=1 Tax=Pseudochrobactrum sp. Wa41.01b-1 TaxID=2864102 RepID=UPI001C687C77|nr:hypothetical protein [Pseudochrobactrum sp. Wa41.01b-1]QYM72454.1 hypothetical protein K1X45_13385 [Pseudochrobactrum sp. Wa41.01b-1]